MVKEMKELCAAAVALTLAYPAFSADSEGNYAVRGLGGQTCSQFASAVVDSEKKANPQAIALFSSWVNGYLTRMNRTTDGVFDASPIIEGKDILQLVYNQCVAKPEALFENMVGGVVDALSSAAVPSQSKIVSLASGQQQRAYRKSTIQLAQTSLIEKGFLDGEADGVVGPSTTAAVRQFQEANKINVTGFMDYSTMILLLVK